MRVALWRTGMTVAVVPNDLRLTRRYRWFALVLCVAGAAPLHAQSGNGYLFGRPQGSLTLRGGFSGASANSDLFDDMTNNLTLRRRDFSGLSVGGELAVSATESLDLSLDAGYVSTSKLSHYRDFVDTNNGEIEQTTSLRRVPVTLNAKLYLSPRGRAIGRLAWIPNHVTPWVGAGGGFMYYRFQQEGDFVDANTLAVFHDVFLSSGTTPMAQAMAGVDVSLSPRLAVTGGARYLMAKRAKLSTDFTGFQPIDLSGAELSLGLTVRL